MDESGSRTPTWMDYHGFDWMCGDAAVADRLPCVVFTCSPCSVLVTGFLACCVCRRNRLPAAPPRAKLKLCLLMLMGIGILLSSLSVDPLMAGKNGKPSALRLPYPYIAAMAWVCWWLLCGWFLARRSETSVSITVGAASAARAVTGCLLFDQHEHSQIQVIFIVTQAILCLLGSILVLLTVMAPADASASELRQKLISVAAESGEAKKETENIKLDPDAETTGEDLFPHASGWVEWLAEYAKMHEFLVERAKRIVEEGQKKKTDKAKPDGDIESTWRTLRTDVLSYCPKRYLILGIICSTGLTLTNFAQPYLTGRLYDAALENARQPNPDWGAMDSLLEVIAALMFFNYLGKVLVGIFFALAAHTTVARLRVQVFANVAQQDVAFFDGQTSGALSSRLINDSAALQSLAQVTTNDTLQSILKLVAALAAMFLTHWTLALVATCITPLTWFITRRTGTIVGHYAAVQREAMAKANSLAVEVLGSIRTVQANAAEEREASAFTQLQNRFLRIVKFTLVTENALRFTRTGLSQGRDLVVLLIGVRLIVRGEMTLGSFVAFDAYVTLYKAGFNSLADLWINFAKTLAATGRFMQMLQRVPDIRPDVGLQPLVCAGTLRFEQVSFAYASNLNTKVLSDVSFTAVPGTVTALVGESGAGKSTIGRLIERFYDPVTGSISMDGADYRSLSIRWLRRQIGFVEQEPVLFDRSIRHNLVYGTDHTPSDEAIEDAAKLARAHHFILELPQGYDSRPGEKGVRLSGGQKQRLAIARAIVKNPRVLLLDEATSALDSETESLVQHALDSLMEGRTTVVIAHRLSTVVGATQILVLDRGHIIERGTHAELTAVGTSRYARFMRHQLIDSQGSAAPNLNAGAETRT